MDRAYSFFASVYDTFMQEIPYDDWVSFIADHLKRAGFEDGLVLELGCGTGEVLRRLGALGYDMIGLDSSIEMLDVAREKYPEALYICQDAADFELYGTVGAIVSVCDSLNYITDRDELLSVFRLANNYLEAGGLFIFDLNTRYKYRELMGENTFADSAEDAAFIWDNYFDEKTGINEYSLTLFVKGGDGRYERHEEEHYERCYTLREVTELIGEAGMEFVGAFAGYTDTPLLPGEDETDVDRMVIVAREKRQAGKKYE